MEGTGCIDRESVKLAANEVMTEFKEEHGEDTLPLSKFQKSRKTW